MAIGVSLCYRHGWHQSDHFGTADGWLLIPSETVAIGDPFVIRSSLLCHYLIVVLWYLFVVLECF
ncbi:Uncharacterised protein [Vibrio cholerae]|nr:Uncharacterised protein [Vibrio cholerae]